MAPNVDCCTMAPFQRLLLLAVELDKAVYYHLENEAASFRLKINAGKSLESP